MTTPGPHPVTGRDRTRRAIAIVALASVGLAAAGCSSAGSIDGGSPAAAAAPTGSGETPAVTESTEPDAAPTLPTWYELLAQDRFVALTVALERSGLDNVIDDLDNFVLLAPINSAFAASGTDIGIEYASLMDDARLLEAILRYHIVGDPSTNQSWRTLNGAVLDVDGAAVDTIAAFDGADVLDRIPVRNGTVFVMPRLLLPAPGPIVSSTESQPAG